MARKAQHCSLTSLSLESGEQQLCIRSACSLPAPYAHLEVCSNDLFLSANPSHAGLCSKPALTRGVIQCYMFTSDTQFNVALGYWERFT